MEIDVAPELPEFEIDEARMAQVLRNVLENALRYTPEGGTILVSASFSGGELLLQVCDSGPGDSGLDLQRIFERFYRTDPSRQRADGGSGLGLAIARSLVEKHNGTITAESRPGQGLTIRIRLPLNRRG